MWRNASASSPTNCIDMSDLGVNERTGEDRHLFESRFTLALVHNAHGVQ